MLLLNSSFRVNDNQCLYGHCTCPEEHDEYETCYHALTLPMISAILHDTSSLRYIYYYIFVFVVLIGLMNNICSLLTFLQKKIRETIFGVYLAMYSACSILLTLLLLTNIITAIYYNEYLFRLWACYSYPYLSLILVYTSIVISSIFAIEHVLSIFTYIDQYTSPKRAFYISLSVLLTISISNLDKIFGRNLIFDDEFNYFYCTYKTNSYQLWSRFLFYVYIIIPCFIHLICIFIIVIKKRNLQQILSDFKIIIPSLIIIFCMSLHALYRYSLNFCLTSSSNYSIRLHVAFTFLLYTPLICSYMIYILPNSFYEKQFYGTWFYRRLCGCFYHKRREIQEFAILEGLWRRRTSLETFKTITNLDDDCIPSEFYKNLKIQY